MSIIYAVHKRLLNQPSTPYQLGTDGVEFVIKYYEFLDAMYMRSKESPNRSEKITYDVLYGTFLKNVKFYLNNNIWIRISKEQANDICKQWYLKSKE